MGRRRGRGRGRKMEKKKKERKREREREREKEKEKERERERTDLKEHMIKHLSVHVYSNSVISMVYFADVSILVRELTKHPFHLSLIPSFQYMPLTD